MPREIVQPTRNERGDDEHPAWALIGAVRSSGTGTVLFDSDIKHQHTVVVTLRRASRRRDLHRDWLYGYEQLIEVEMSEAQWASFVSSVGGGQGVPCTLRHDPAPVPDVPYEPRLAESMEEVHDAAHRAAEQVAQAFADYNVNRTKANLRSLEAAINNMPRNVEFAARSLSEHAENVVQRARADVEAMVTAKAQQLGIDPGELGVSGLQLESGERS